MGSMVLEHACLPSLKASDKRALCFVAQARPLTRPCHDMRACVHAGLTAPGDDFNYGSAATLDVQCLQALSQRIHYGKWVAEAKFQ